MLVAAHDMHGFVEVHRTACPCVSVAGLAASTKRVGKHHGLFTTRSHGYDLDGGVHEFGNAVQITLGRRGQRIEAAHMRYLFLPPWPTFIDWTALGEYIDIGGKVMQTPAFEFIGGANPQRFQPTQDVELGDGDARQAIESRGVAQQYGIKPAAPAAAAGGGPEFGTALLQALAGGVQQL